ncbi:hypothetical protein [Endozoicomonas sp.]
MSTSQIKALPLQQAIKIVPLAQLLAIVGANPHFASALTKAYLRANKAS